MEIYLGKNNKMSIERGFNNVRVVLEYSYDDRKLVEDNEILLYTTDRFICDYNFETGLYASPMSFVGFTESPRKRNDSIWTESYIKSVWQSYDVGDTIK
jgi:hypothetical protein